MRYINLIEFPTKIDVEYLLLELKTEDQRIEDLTRKLKVLDRLIDGGTPYEAEIENAKARKSEIIAKLEEFGIDPYANEMTDWSTVSFKGMPTRKKKTEQTSSSAARDTFNVANFKVIFFGHYYDPNAGKRGSDKVWGVGVLNDHKVITFWGARDKTPQTKWTHATDSELSRVYTQARQKERKGYDKQNPKEWEKFIEHALRKDPKFKEAGFDTGGAIVIV